MLNDELARILMAERLRVTNEHVRQGSLRRALAERKAGDREALRGSGVPSCPEPSRRTKPALG